MASQLVADLQAAGLDPRHLPPLHSLEPAKLKKVMKTFIEVPPRKLQSDGYSGPITISAYQKFDWLRNQLKTDGVHIGLPVGN